MSKSLFVISLGPCGSGKSYTMNKISKILLNEYSQILKNSDDFNFARIDDYVEKDSTYTNQILEIINNTMQVDQDLFEYVTNLNANNQIQNEIQTYFTNGELSKNLIKLDKLSVFLTEIYFDTRKKYDLVCDENLNALINKRENIIFETTGKSKLNWLFECTAFKDPIILNDYIIILVYLHVPIDVLLSRVLQRFASNLNSKSVPRLPSLITSECSLINSIERIQNNVTSHIFNCVNKCDNKIHKIFLHNNINKTKFKFSSGLQCCNNN